MGTVSTLPNNGQPRGARRGARHRSAASSTTSSSPTCSAGCSSGQTTVVLGNRGAGKSAIFQMLARRSRAGGAG